MRIEYDAINRLSEVHCPNSISTYNIYDAGNRITKLLNACDGCGWEVSCYAYSIDFSGNPGGFNLLNTPDNLYTELGPDGFWNAYNKPFLDAAISRGDEFIIATPIIDDNLYLLGSQELTGFGREYFYLLEQGYEYMNGRMVIK